MKNHKIVNNSGTTEAREEISTDLESLELVKNVDICVTKFKKNQILSSKICHGNLVTTYLFTE